MTPFPMSLIFGLACASDFTSSKVCTWSPWGIQYENTLLKPPQICQLYGGILDGGVDQRIFDLSTAAPLGKPKRQLPMEVL